MAMEKVEKLVYPDCDCTTDWEHDQHTVVCDHCGNKVDEGEITDIEGKWTCDTCYRRLYL
jgi:formylmethanofuran dehydrogenase subunit E